MNRFSFDERRLSAEQRDRVLELAARLQAQDEDTIAVGDLARSVAEAGIDPRFVHEAASRLDETPRELPRSLGVALGAFTFQAAFFVFIQNVGVGGGRSVSAFEVAFAVAMAFFLGLWAARERTVRWYAPLTALGVWFALFLATTGLTALSHVDQGWVLQTAVVFGLAQAVAVLFGAVAATGLDRLDRPATARGARREV